MIGFLSGVVKSISLNQIILDIHGVGYRISTPNNIKAANSDKLDLYIHTHVREDALTLYGFSTQKELNLFETLISVSGIGPKIGLTLLSATTPEAIENAIRLSDVNFFTAIPGIGKKGAQRLIVDLKTKLTKIDLDLNSFSENSDLTLALSNLGFKASEIKSVLSKVDSNDSLENQIKSALKFLR
jgi:holliday junction DNA helicase RuvA